MRAHGTRKKHAGLLPQVGGRVAVCPCAQLLPRVLPRASPCPHARCRAALQLTVDGKWEGPHVFVVRLRDDAGNFMPGACRATVLCWLELEAGRGKLSGTGAPAASLAA